MNRREILKTVLAGAATIGVSLASSRSPYQSQKKGTPSRTFIQSPDGTELFYQDWGKGSSILFVAPWGLHSGWWEYQIPYLTSKGFRCIAFDRRGHGRSDHPSLGYDFDTLSTDLSALIEQLDLRSVTLVGHSMGCGEVVRYLSRFGAQRVAKVILVATITPLTLKTSDNPAGIDSSILDANRLKFSQDRPKQIADAAAAFFGTSKNKISNEIIQWWVRMMVDQCEIKTLLELHRAMTETDFRDDLKKIRVRTLLVHGDSDQSANINLTSRRTLSYLSNGELKIYEDAAHGLPVTHRDQLNNDIVEFIAG